MHLDGDVDLRPIGTVDVTGVRVGDRLPVARVCRHGPQLGSYGAARIGGRAWSRSPAAAGSRPRDRRPRRETVDLQALDAALVPGYRATAEDRGIEVIEGARARRCRVAVDGATFRAAFPQVRWLVGDADLAPLARPARLLGLPRRPARAGRGERQRRGDRARAGRGPGDGRGPADGDGARPRPGHLSSGSMTLERRDETAHVRQARPTGPDAARRHGPARPPRGIRPTDIARRVGVATRTVYRDLRALEERGRRRRLVGQRPVGRRQRGVPAAAQADPRRGDGRRPRRRG